MSSAFFKSGSSSQRRRNSSTVNRSPVTSPGGLTIGESMTALPPDPILQDLGPGGLRRCRRCSPRDFAGQSLVERNVVFLQSLAQHLVERHAGARVSDCRIHFGYLRGDQHALIDNDVVECGNAIRELLALGGE